MNDKPPAGDDEDQDIGEDPSVTPSAEEEVSQDAPQNAGDASDAGAGAEPPAEEGERTVFQPSEAPAVEPDADGAKEAETPVPPDRTVFAPGIENHNIRDDNGADAEEPREPDVPDRTVFAPSLADEPATQEPAGEADRTQFAGSGDVPKTELAGSVPPGHAPETASYQSIRPGQVLNHIYEVKRLIARGGMGEVFEGLNVNMDERVAIKVILPALAADPDVVGMFRKEARTLTDLSHESLVSYRVLAQEPELGVLYIVTDYIDGVSLADELHRLDASTDEILAFATRLASGLRVAHARGVIHRDLSPDNILLPDGKLQRAKIIDFGIAKDLDPGSQTIVGDGFAGKLGYVAPEQLGDFERLVGPWTDVYSLGLCLLAVARGRSASMGATLVEAVDKRRAGADLEGIEPRLQSLLAWMLQPDPRARPQSMAQLLDAIRAAEQDGFAPADGDEQVDSFTSEGSGGVGSGSRKVAIGVAIGLALLMAGASYWWFAGYDETPAAAGQQATVVKQPEGLPVVDQARRVVNTALPSVSCTWLSIVDVAQQKGDLTIRFTGVAGNPAAAQADIARSLGASGVKSANLDFEEVAPITQGGCSALDTYRQIRDPFGEHLTVAQRQFEMRMQPQGSVYAGKMAANAILKLDTDIGDKDFALVGLDNSGLFTVLVNSKAEFERIYREKLALIELTGPEKYRMTIDLDHEGWSGMLLVTGKGPFPDKLIAPPVGGRGTSWQSEFMTAAGRNDWHTEMVWFRSVR